MNFELKKQLDIAYNYYEYEYAEYISKIDENRSAISSFKYAFKRRAKPKTPETQMTEQSVKNILLCLFLWPVGLMNLHNSKKNKDELELQANQRFVEEMKAYEEFCAEVYNNINHALSNITKLEAERKKFQQANMQYLLFLGPNYQNRRSVASLRRYVADGRADSLKEAKNLMHEDMQREHALQMQQEMFEREMAERQRCHEETLDSLKEVKRKQDEAAAQRQQLQNTLSKMYYEFR